MNQEREVIFRQILLPLILENYEERALGLAPDEWFWADELAFSWGFTTEGVI